MLQGRVLEKSPYGTLRFLYIQSTLKYKVKHKNATCKMFCLKMSDLAKHLLTAYKPHVALAEGQPGGVIIGGHGARICL